MSDDNAKGMEPAPAVTVDPELETSPAAPADDEQARVEAFLAEPVWRGRVLHPFSSGRESLFLSLRHAAGAPPLAEVLENYDAFFADAIRLLYLCSHEPHEWRHLRANPALWLEEIEKWADRAVPLSMEREAKEAGVLILSLAARNRHEVAPPQNPGHDTPPGN